MQKSASTHSLTQHCPGDSIKDWVTNFDVHLVHEFIVDKFISVFHVRPEVRSELSRDFKASPGQCRPVAYLFSPDEFPCHVLSTRNNCCEFLPPYDVHCKAFSSYKSYLKRIFKILTKLLSGSRLASDT